MRNYSDANPHGVVRGGSTGALVVDQSGLFSQVSDGALRSSQAYVSDGALRSLDISQ